MNWITVDVEVEECPVVILKSNEKWIRFELILTNWIDFIRVRLNPDELRSASMELRVRFNGLRLRLGLGLNQIYQDWYSKD